jgi:hypothetical protein
MEEALADAARESDEAAARTAQNIAAALAPSQGDSLLGGLLNPNGIQCKIPPAISGASTNRDLK